MARVVHFEISADDTGRAKQFYADAFGWSFHEFPEMNYTMISTGDPTTPGIDGGMSPRTPQIASTAPNFVLGVEDLDVAIEKATGAGGTVVVPKMGVPGHGWLAYMTDTEGNLFGMMQSDPSAA